MALLQRPTLMINKKIICKEAIADRAVIIRVRINTIERLSMKEISAVDVRDFFI